MNILKAFRISQQQQPKVIKNYSPFVPSGLIAQTEKGYFYIKGKKKFKFISDRARDSWNIPIVLTKEPMLADLQLAGVLGFRDGSLVQDISDGKIYLISDNKRRHIIDPDVLEWINSEVIKVGQKEIFVHAEGEKL
jgi:hypothetical protein